MSQPASAAPSRKKTVISLLVFAASAVGFFIAQRHLGQMGAELPKEA